ncbi:MAG: LysR family transcriptional regulator [Rhodospirillales bacterium]|nr:MAG: LysR family transcriptional regulator [Rhodospirillales bacterium]
MKPTLAPGLAATRRFEVDKDRTIGFMGEEGRVYATPSMVRDIEMTCRDFLLTQLDAGEDSVGTRVEFDHMAATPLGMAVEFTATVAEVKGRAVTFEVTGKDAVDQICRGKHMRFVVDVAKTLERLKAKAAKA